MSGALRRNAHEILEALDESVIKLKRALKDRSETQSEHIRRTTRDNREFDGSHTDSNPGGGGTAHHGPTGGGRGDGHGTPGHSSSGDTSTGVGLDPRPRGHANPEWLNKRLADPDLPFWRRRIAEGQEFNYDNHYRYPENEVRTSDGRYLDSYNPPTEIVSRKHTQLDEVKPETAKRYLDEIRNKYWPGTGLPGGRELRGQPYLEVPSQSGPIPREVIEYANSFDPPIIIRDPSGHEYN